MIGFGEIQRNLIRSDAIGWLPRRWWTCRAVVRLAGCHIVGGIAEMRLAGCHIVGGLADAIAGCCIIGGFAGAIGWLPRSWLADVIGWLLLNWWTC